MNRIAQLIITLSVSFCAMSCIEEVSTELPDTSDYITVTSEVDMQTKAGYEGTSVLPGSFTMTIKQGTGSAKDYTMNRARTSSNHYNFSGNAPTWTTSDVSQVLVKAITASEGDIDSDGTLDFAVQNDQSSDSAVQSSDLLGAKTGAGITISGNNINVAFNHLMSKLQVSYTSELEIDHIELVNVAVAGTYNYTEMKHVYPVTSTGTIIMFNNTKSAEAIFFPFDPKEEKVTPELHIYLKNQEILKPKLTLKDGSRFLPGKLYMVNISVSGNSEVKIENWGANANVQIPGERVLWIGTSIPSGHPGLYTSYPELVDEALNCTVVNNAKPSSYVVPMSYPWNSTYYTTYKGDPAGKNGAFAQSVFTAIGCLSLTYQELRDLHYNKLMEVSNNDSEWAEEIISETHRLYSYESLIIPYIDGSKDNCTTVILDHGFNDRHFMYNEAGAYLFDDPYTTTSVRGYNFLMDLATGRRTWQDYLTHFDWIETIPGFVAGNIILKNSFIYRMSQVIQKIWEANPNVRIIIGNYFTTTNPYLKVVDAGAPGTGLIDWPDFERLPRLICANNQAIAGIWDLDIVNVQNYLWISDEDYWAGWDPNAVNAQGGKGAPIYDETKFCPDGVHPWANPKSIQAIADVYINALDGVIGSRVN